MTTKDDWTFRANYLRKMADAMKVDAENTLVRAANIRAMATHCDAEAERIRREENRQRRAHAPQADTPQEIGALPHLTE